MYRFLVVAIHIRDIFQLTLSAPPPEIRRKNSNHFFKNQNRSRKFSERFLYNSRRAVLGKFLKALRWIFVPAVMFLLGVSFTESAMAQGHGTQ
jgi:hypothetical protein